MAQTEASSPLIEFLLFLGDNDLILGHRLSEWCGHGPALEEDIALANLSLDLIGQTQLWLNLAGQLEGEGRSADDLAYRRDAFDFRNALLLEQPNGDFAQTLMRQFLFDAWHLPVLQQLTESPHVEIAAIAEKASKEVAYHLERSRDLVIRLGDGTEDSHQRMQNALDLLLPYTGDLYLGRFDHLADTLNKLSFDAVQVENQWYNDIDQTLTLATLSKPEGNFRHTGAWVGRHTEHLGYLLAEMQFLPRAYPDAVW